MRSECSVISEQWLLMLVITRVISDLVDTVRSKISSMYSVAEAVALLDSLLCLARYGKRSVKSCIPIITESGPLAVVQGRHPIMESVSKINVIPVCMLM